ncbi:probable chitinase 10 [Aricia agestis]|uniref:probable chitinase 10 n=1 Tax=Aricia agestis TaxID=91739 RepID=UPI001C20B0F1|nr:probable chitinase 10 [Aricia agestis]
MTMIEKTIIFLLVVGVTYAASSDKPLYGVDPNILSCDPNGKVFLLLPHFTNCSRYYQCAHGNEVEMSCAVGTQFDFELQGCNWPRSTICWLRVQPETEIDGSGEGEFDYLSDRADNPLDGSINSLTADAVLDSVRPMSIETPLKSVQFGSHINCQRTDTAARRVAYMNDCQRYWRCVNGVPQVAYCTDGLFFNERTQQCDFEANVQCHVEAEVDELKEEFIVYK